MPREQDKRTSTPHSTQLAPAQDMPEQAAPPRAAYQRPTLTALGSIAELTRGGNVSSNSDGFGAAGASGVLS